VGTSRRENTKCPAGPVLLRLRACPSSPG